MSSHDALFAPVSAAELEQTYRSGHSRPSQVVRASLEAIRASEDEDPPLRAVLRSLDRSALTAAERADERWARGEPLSPLDGIPVLVKDNIDVAGVPTTNGTRIEFPLPKRDAWVVDRLRAAGAVVVGKTNLHEIGAGATGINPHFGTTRNPYDPSRWCGGSSSGSAGGVAAGLAPLAVGTDAGGSVRAPAAFVGRVGLKPTFGRVSRLGMSILCDTVDTIGPIAASCADAATFLAAAAGVNPEDEETWDQPPMPTAGELRGALASGGRGLRVGFARGVLASREVSMDVADRVVRAAEALEEQGAALHDVELPDLEECLLAGLTIIAAEGTSGLEDTLYAHRDLLGYDLQVLLALGGRIRARDYLAAQRYRQRVRRAWRSLFDEVDLVLLPAAGIPAAPIPEDATKTGELDEETTARSIACTMPSNLTGFPALSVPCGFVDDMPVSAQLVAPPWEELRLLRAGAVLERSGLCPRRRPRRYYGDRLLVGDTLPQATA